MCKENSGSKVLSCCSLCDLSQVFCRVECLFDNHSLMDSEVSFVNAHPLESDLSSGQCYPPFERLGPGARFSVHVFLLPKVSILFLTNVCHNDSSRSRTYA